MDMGTQYKSIFMMAVLLICTACYSINSSTDRSVSIESNVSPTSTLGNTNTETPRPGIIFTPVVHITPTLSPEEKVRLTKKLLQKNGGCTFPCWWGMTPGSSMWSEKSPFITTLAFHVGAGMNNERERKTYNLQYAYFPVSVTPTLIDSLMVTFYVNQKTGVIDAISSSQEYEIIPLIEEFDSPDRILARASGIPTTGPSSYEIELVYSQKGIELNVSGDAQLLHRENGDLTIVCLDEIYQDSRGVFLWAPAQHNLNEELQSNYWEGNRFININELLQMDNQEFIRWLLGKAKENCIEFPMRFWY
jgi:hypothetical protein